VRKGQTLYRIALTYRVSLDELVKYNDIDDPFMIRSGEKIFIPGAVAHKDVPVITPPRGVKRKIFIFPLRGKITGYFGAKRRGHRHKGLDIAAPRGTPVKVANSGRVAYSGAGFSGYGKMILVDHQNGFVTLYAHLQNILTHRGRLVRQGDVIGRVGDTGRATGPHLHFEIRYNDRLVNPLHYLRR